MTSTSGDIPAPTQRVQLYSCKTRWGPDAYGDRIFSSRLLSRELREDADRHEENKSPPRSDMQRDAEDAIGTATQESGENEIRMKARTKR